MRTVHPSSTAAVVRFCQEKNSHARLVLYPTRENGN